MHNEAISTYSTEEGEAQQIALNHSKINTYWWITKNLIAMTFYIFYQLHDFDLLITDPTSSHM